jgi:hypothetical protein
MSKKWLFGPPESPSGPKMARKDPISRPEYRHSPDESLIPVQPSATEKPGLRKLN